LILFKTKRFLLPSISVSTKKIKHTILPFGMVSRNKNKKQTKRQKFVMVTHSCCFSRFEGNWTYMGKRLNQGLQLFWRFGINFNGKSYVCIVGWSFHRTVGRKTFFLFLFSLFWFPTVIKRGLQKKFKKLGT